MSALRKPGRPRKMAESRLFPLRLPPELHGALKVYAAARAVSLNDLLLEMIADAWARTPKHEAYAALVATAQRK